MWLKELSIYHYNRLASSGNRGMSVTKQNYEEAVFALGLEFSPFSFVSEIFTSDLNLIFSFFRPYNESSK